MTDVWIVLVLAVLFAAACWLRRWRLSGCFYRGRAQPSAEHRILNQPKPPWVREEVLRLKALMPTHGCRKVAATFNHIHRRRRMTVGKTFVADTLRKEGHRLAEIRRAIRRRRPRPMSKNLLWGMDLTYWNEQPVLGGVDHGTRACIALKAVGGKTSLTLLRALLDAIERFGKPKIVRTDNEAVFTSFLFRFGLALLGIRHQRTAPFAPWQNGRIERFFGTLKAALRQRPEPNAQQPDLDIFRIWHNHVRPHENLDGLTPAMAWDRRVPKGRQEPLYVSEWDGLLTGFYFR